MRSRLLIGGLLLGAACFAAGNEALHFTWALVFRRGAESERSIDYTAELVRLASGDRFRLHFQPRSRCWLYLYLHDAEGNLYRLGQRAFAPAKGLEAEPGLTLPEGDNWYLLDSSPGVEVFYLIVSGSRLRRLEKLAGREPARQARSGGLPRLARKQAVLGEIRRLILESSTLAEPAWQPVTVAGEFRGISEESDYLGVEVQAESIYVRTIRLEH